VALDAETPDKSFEVHRGPYTEAAFAEFLASLPTA
jgi:hypothetical protein